jgi:hypothetical protein
LVLQLNQETCASRLHVHGADRTQCRLTSQSFGHRVPDLSDHPRSSAPDLLLLPRSSLLDAMPHLPPAHHETSNRDSPNEHEGRIEPQKYPEFKFKPRHVNDSSHVKPRHRPLGFSHTIHLRLVIHRVEMLLHRIHTLHLHHIPTHRIPTLPQLVVRRVVLLLNHIHTLHLQHIHILHLNLFTLEVVTTRVVGRIPLIQLNILRG